MRKIIHIDMDYFFAQVEMRANPRLLRQPVAVGGKPNQRSVVAACSYEARKFGIHSAMSMYRAKQLCPQLIIVPVRMQLYRQVSRHIQLIFKQYTALIEPLSLDEAFLDVTNCSRCQGSASLIAQEIRHKIFITQNLTASAGIAPNKFLAKIASDWQKPNGQFVISPAEIAAFMLQLPVNKIFGVGKVTSKKMAALNIHTAKDLQRLSMPELKQHFGRFGFQLYNLSRGIDERAVTNYRERKSLSVEHTFTEDLSLAKCLLLVPEIHQELIHRQQNLNDDVAVKAVFVKLKFKDFTSTSCQQISVNFYDVQIFINLVKIASRRKNLAIRLLGLGMQFKPKTKKSQYLLDL